jgi:hypothetical protein
MSKEELYNKLTDGELRKILECSDGLDRIDLEVEDIDFKDFKHIYMTGEQIFFYSIKDYSVNGFDLFDAQEFKSYIRERIINNIIE